MPEVVNCPDCGGLVSRKATKCPHCGNPEPHSTSDLQDDNLRDRKNAQSQPGVASESSKSTDQDPGELRKAGSTRRRSRALWVAAAVLAVGIISVVLVLVFSGSNTPSPTPWPAQKSIFQEEQESRNQEGLEDLRDDERAAIAELEMKRLMIAATVLSEQNLCNGSYSDCVDFCTQAHAACYKDAHAQGSSGRTAALREARRQAKKTCEGLMGPEHGNRCRDICKLECHGY